MRLSDRVAIVTGGGSGIGEAICEKFAHEGAKIVVADMVPQAANTVAGKVKAIGQRALPYIVNVADYDQVAKLVQATMDEFGRVDILVNCAGYGEFIPTEELPLEKWRRMIDVNLNGTFYCCIATAKEMMKKNYGKIINVSSMAGLAGVPNNAHYVASKHGVVGLTRALAIDFAKYHINVNCLCPGTTYTPLNVKIMTPEYMATRAKRVPLGRLAQPEDQANAALFLASSESDYVTGLIMYVDGGMYSLFSGYAAGP
jgi:NAD(P)-dependent dehydrogenase (short-subunit alcohol dehydrogenase family)